MTQLDSQALVLGEILFDIFDDKRRLGGAPFNFAYHLFHFGIPTVFVSRVGDDELGREAIAFSEKSGFPSGGIQIDPEKATGEARVSPHAFGGPRFNILTDRAFDFIKNEGYLDSRKVPALAYFGTLGQRAEVSRQTIKNYLNNKKGKTKIFLDLNLRRPFYDYGIVDASLSLCDFLKVNDEELMAVQKLLGLNYYFGISSLMDHLHREYNIHSICVTRGEQGCELFEKGNPTPLKQAAVRVENFQDSVGAGDAFSAMLALGIIKKWDMEMSLKMAALFASKICSIKGALPETSDIYTTFPSFNV